MIIVYTGNNCAYCKQTKKYLDHFNKDYLEVNVDEDEEVNREYLKQISGQMSVPVIVKDKKIIVGYKPAELAKL